MGALHDHVITVRNLRYVSVDMKAAQSHWCYLADGMMTRPEFFGEPNWRWMRVQKATAGIHGHRANRRRMAVHNFRERQIVGGGYQNRPQQSYT